MKWKPLDILVVAALLSLVLAGLAYFRRQEPIVVIVPTDVDEYVKQHYPDAV